MSFPNSPPVLIIGAGIAGLTLARTLRTHNIPSPVFNASASSRRQGFGITLRSWAYDRLQTDNMKLIEAAAVDGKMGGKGFISTDLIDIESGKVLSIPGPRVNAEEAAAKPQEHFRANRFRLREFLRDGIDVHWEHKLISFGPGEDGKGVLAIFADKTQVAGSLLVGADGVFSTELAPQIFPVCVYNGIIRLPFKEYADKFGPAMKGSNVVAGVGDNIILALSINDLSPDDAELSWIYSRPVRGEDDPLYRSRQYTDVDDIAPELFDELAQLGPLVEPFASIFSHEEFRKLSAHHWMMRSVQIKRDVLDEALKAQRAPVVLLGDAAHAMPIFAGEGGNHALVDGVELGTCIAEHGIDGVRNFYDHSFGKWHEAIERSEKRLVGLHQPLGIWKKLSQGGN